MRERKVHFYLFLFYSVPPRVSPITDSILVVLWNTSITLSFKISPSQPPIDRNDVVWTFTSRLTGEERELSYNEGGTRYRFTKNRCSLTIHPVRVSDTGSYKLTASNDGGRSSAVIIIQQVLGQYQIIILILFYSHLYYIQLALSLVKAAV